jgi:hypothetical protein
MYASIAVPLALRVISTKVNDRTLVRLCAYRLRTTRHHSLCLMLQSTNRFIGTKTSDEPPRMLRSTNPSWLQYLRAAIAIPKFPSGETPAPQEHRTMAQNDRRRSSPAYDPCQQQLAGVWLFALCFDKKTQIMRPNRGASGTGMLILMPLSLALYQLTIW